MTMRTVVDDHLFTIHREFGVKWFFTSDFAKANYGDRFAARVTLMRLLRDGYLERQVSGSGAKLTFLFRLSDAGLAHLREMQPKKETV